MVLTTGVSLAAGLAALVLYYVVSSILAWRRLRDFKGPWLASFSYLWMARTSTSGHMWSIYRDVSAKYGPVARIGPNELVTDDPDIIRRLSSTRSQYRRSSWYDPNRLDPYEHSMFSLRDNAAHDKLKSQTAPGYSGKENPFLEAEVDYVIDEMVQKIRSKYVAGPGKLVPLDLAKMCQYFTLDSIGKVAFGQEFGFLGQERDVNHYLQTIEDIAPVMQMCGEIPSLASIVASPLVLRLAGPKVTDTKGLGRLMKVARDIVAKRFGPDAKEQRDMLGAFVRNGLTQRECETEALFQMIAGSDTTATAIRATLLYVMTTPRVYEALWREIDEAVKDSKISSPIKSVEGEALPYLQAVIFEGLRIHPPFVGLPMKEVPPQGDTLLGQFVPGGTRIAPSNWSLTRNKRIFGEDSELFRPERWVEASDETREEMRRTVELIFGYGRWACAGKSLAFLELNKVFVELLRNFDFQLVYPTRPWTSINHNLFLQKDMWVSVTERQRTS
ncbi:Cytochrome p450 [Pleurostoma richardsiae]|uniref:Cytochrome P450 monooxygenase ABA1 n=1 Tax=Pleurostoma richardsiae TaxID=41990 RepID=A0AA38VIB8_9PEZI|nr:Cytochrome p450 [Pleurostoma richardsiae]